MKSMRIAAALAFVLGGASIVHAQAVDLVQLAGSGTTQQVQDAIKNGADVNAADKDGKTPLIWAAAFNPNPDVVLILLKAGADPKAKTTDGKNAFDLAGENANVKGTEAYRQFQKAVQ